MRWISLPWLWLLLFSSSSNNNNNSHVNIGAVVVIHAFDIVQLQIRSTCGCGRARATAFALPSSSPLSLEESSKPFNKEDNVGANDHNSHTNDCSDTAYSSVDYSLTYSPNFHRHIVWKQETPSGSAVVVQSFPWLDQALQQYPQAVPCSLPWERVEIAGADSDLARNTYASNSTATTSSRSATPVATGSNDYSNNDTQDLPVLFVLYEWFQQTLSWFPSQVDQLLERVPSLIHWPMPVLEERIQFLLAPTPPHVKELLEAEVGPSGTTVRFSSLGAAPVDWPKLFYNHGQGAGMSKAQVTHGLSTVPEVLLRIETPEPLSPSPRLYSEMARMYQETPSVVLEVAQSQLSYFLQGASNLDNIALAYLHYKGWDFLQLYLQLHALPATLQVSRDNLGVGQVLVGRRRQLVRSSPLTEDWVRFWQVRFQMRPLHVHALLRTHSRLSLCTVPFLEERVEWLMDRVIAPTNKKEDAPKPAARAVTKKKKKKKDDGNKVLDSSHLRALLFKMPSLLSTSLDALEERYQFWTGRSSACVGLAAATQFPNTLLQHPSLLSYSISNNLRPKLDFFLRELHWNKTDLQALTVKYPAVWGRSLPNHMRIVARGLAAATNEEELERAGNILARAPELWNFNWNRTLQPKVDYLRNQCGPNITSRIVWQTPRVLRQSVSNTLAPNLQRIERACGSFEVLQETPSLLLVIKPGALDQRLERMRKKKRKLSSSTLAASVEAHWKLQWAYDANATPVSPSPSTEKQRVATKATLPAPEFSKAALESLTRDLASRMVAWEEEFKGPPQHTDTRAPSTELSQSSSNATSLVAKDATTTTTLTTKSLTLCVTARAFPSEEVLRGRRRAGGMAFYVPTFVRGDWRKLVTTLWKGQKLQALSDGKTLLLGYNYLRPSRNRCILYALREALRAARIWVQDEHGKDSAAVTLQGQEVHYNVTIVTDSNYCLDLLSNHTQVVYDWGGVKTLDQFVCDGGAAANPDILYPLSRSWARLVNESDHVHVSFQKGALDVLGNGAQLAAWRMYDSTK